MAFPRLAWQSRHELFQNDLQNPSKSHANPDKRVGIPSSLASPLDNRLFRGHISLSTSVLTASCQRESLGAPWLPFQGASGTTKTLLVANTGRSVQPDESQRIKYTKPPRLAPRGSSPHRLAPFGQLFSDFFVWSRGEVRRDRDVPGDRFHCEFNRLRA